jgi:hypothetical protein
MDKATDLLPLKIEDALDATPICMIEKVIDPLKIEAFIAYHLIHVSAMINVDTRLNLQPAQVKFIAQSLRENFSYESLADINLCLKRGAMGFYGDIFRIDGAVIMGWMEKYLDEKYDALEQRKAKEKHPDKAKPVKQVVDGSKYIKQMLENLGVPNDPPKDNAKENAYQRHKVESQHHVTTADELQKKQLHIEYIRANYNPDGSKKPTWIPEQDWTL